VCSPGLSCAAGRATLELVREPGFYEALNNKAGAFRERIDNITAVYPWLVYEEGDDIAGYAYAGPWKARHAYRFATECTVYLSPDYHGKGIGTALYKQLFAKLCAMSVRTVMAGIALPNAGSVALHEKMGFEKVAHFKEVGWKFEKWIDVAYWQLILD